jgi:hypothetical protein
MTISRTCTTNNVVVCPCTHYQIDLIKFLKSKNHNVIGINPVSTEATNLCDVHIKADIFSTEEILNLLPEVKAVFTDESDIAVIPCQKIAESLKVKCNTFDSINKFSCNKIGMYNHARSQNIDVLDFQFVTSEKDIQMPFPFILKPSDSTNSRGVFLVTKEEEVPDLFAKSLTFSKNKVIIAQKYGDSKFQITVEGICVGGKHHCLTASYKGDYWTPSMCSSLRWPLEDRVDDSKLSQIYSIVDKFVESTNIDFCITHAELILVGEKIYLNEIGCRGGGFSISSKIAPWITGINFYEVIYQYVMNGVKFNPVGIKKRAALLKFLTTNEYAKDHPHILDTNKMENIEYTPNPASVRRGYLIALADRSEEINEDDYVCRL